MAEEKKAKSSGQGAASTVALENLAEAVARGTLRALDERQLASDGGAKVNLPIGNGTTIFGILIPPCRDEWGPGEGPFGLDCCHHHIILGILITPDGPFRAVETPAGDPGQGIKV